MNLIDEYYKQTPVKSLKLDMVKDFQNYILNTPNENKDIIESYVNSLRMPDKSRSFYKKTLRNFISQIVIHEIETENQEENKETNYMVPVKIGGKTVDSVIFEDNLTVPSDHPYNNFNGLIGLTRCTSERFYGELVICYFYPERQQDSYAEFITDEEAYHMCAIRNKTDLALELGINLTEEREIIEPIKHPKLDKRSDSIWEQLMK